MEKEQSKKNFFKNNMKMLVALIIGLTCCCSVVYAVGEYLYNSAEVSYDNTVSNLQARNVQSALDELYVEATSYQLFQERVTDLESMIQENAGFHNSIYRGKDITSYYTDGSLYTKISSGKFTDLYVGDYIVQNDIIWRIAGFDIYYGKGDTALTTHHAVIVPDTALTTSYMNSTNTTANGYVGSYMYTTTLPSVLSTYITPAFSTHVLEYKNLLTTSVNTTAYNRNGTNSGASNGWGWQTRKLDLMNENQVFGSISWSSSGYETGSDNVQFPLFRLAPEFISKGRYNWWLRNVTSSTHFALVASTGGSNRNAASSVHGVRPYFYID